MHEQLKMLEEFHKAFRHPLDEGFNISNIKLRTKLHTEECKELNEQLWNDYQEGKITPNLLKEGADLLYVIFGTFVALDLQNELIEAFKRVHESNMSKLGDDGKPAYREDGKIMKGPNYKPPELGDLV